MKFSKSYDVRHSEHCLKISYYNVFRFKNKTVMQAVERKIKKYLKRLNKAFYRVSALIASDTEKFHLFSGYYQHFTQLLTREPHDYQYFKKVFKILRTIAKEASDDVRFVITNLFEHFSMLIDEPSMRLHTRNKIADSYAMMTWNLYNTGELSQMKKSDFENSVKDTYAYIKYHTPKYFRKTYLIEHYEF